MQAQETVKIPQKIFFLVMNGFSFPRTWKKQFFEIGLMLEYIFSYV